MRVLIVDDNEANRRILRVVLSADGHEVVERVNGLEALEVLGTSTFDALITDVLMPGMDGYRLCAEVRRSERTRTLPIIVYSSIYTSASDEQVALRSGADRFISRPATGATLLAALEEISRAPRSPLMPSGPAAEPEILKAYSESLVAKLKEKSQAFETTRARLVEGNENLRRANGALEKDLSEVEYLALHDHLTGLPNRLLFNDRLTMALSQARRRQKMLAVFFMDVDGFKVINDTLGHTVGDELLCLLSDRLRTCVRAEDTLARFGGDEFILLVTGIVTDRDVGMLSQKILEAIRAPFHLRGRTLSVTISIGASVFPTDGQDPKVLLRNADIAMYRSRKDGPNRYQPFTPESSDAFPERLKLEMKLRSALGAGEFLLHYQPIVDLGDGHVRGVEALLRWKATDGDLISPAEFIPVAESSDLIIPISQWVLRSACTQTATWQNLSRSRMTVAVNLSTRVFQQPDLVGEVSSALEEAGLPADCLDLEITESSAMQNVEYSASVLRRLKDLGVQVSLDDFGTGYSSLSYLKRLPIDRIKIDQSFVRNVPHDPDDAAIVSAVIAMTHRMKHTAVAEGVETAEQLSFLREEGCDQGQGYFFSRPLPPSECERTLKASPERPAPFRHLFPASRAGISRMDSGVHAR
jgi:diguanylate cyclase (GGDEF)-like protein